MRTMSIEEAQDSLDYIVEMFAEGSETEIVLTREGKPVAKLIPPDRDPMGETDAGPHK